MITHRVRKERRNGIMRVSTRVEYGMIALTDIAINCEDGSSVSTSDISERQSISQKY